MPLTNHHHAAAAINEAYANPPDTPSAELLQTIKQILQNLDDGILRVASPVESTADSQKQSQWTIHQWIKKAVLLSFRYHGNTRIAGAPGQDSHWFDKVPLKFEGWTEEHFTHSGIRAVPGAVVRHSAHIEPNVILMPCFINIGARVGSGTMIDTWATVGSCAQVGCHVHISGGVGIGGVLEPLQADPVIIEDGAFIGARSEIAEGVRIGKGAVISMGVYLGQSTRIVHRETGKITYGWIPPYSVVVPGTLPDPASPHRPALACAVIVKRVDERTRSKTAINDLLRDTPAANTSYEEHS